jgi:hypothetical protein
VITARPTNLQEASAFMHEAGYVARREQSIAVFLATSLGDDFQLVTTEDTRLLLVLRHDAAAATTRIRAAVKQGPGDAMAMAHAAVRQGLIFSFPTVVTDVPADRLRTKLQGFTKGQDDAQTVTFKADLSPVGGADV